MEQVFSTDVSNINLALITVKLLLAYASPKRKPPPATAPDTDAASAKPDMNAMLSAALSKRQPGSAASAAEPKLKTVQKFIEEFGEAKKNAKRTPFKMLEFAKLFHDNFGKIELDIDKANSLIKENFTTINRPKNESALSDWTLYVNKRQEIYNKMYTTYSESNERALAVTFINLTLDIVNQKVSFEANTRDNILQLSSFIYILLISSEYKSLFERELSTLRTIDFCISFISRLRENKSSALFFVLYSETVRKTQPNKADFLLNLGGDPSMLLKLKNPTTGNKPNYIRLLIDKLENSPDGFLLLSELAYMLTKEKIVSRLTDNEPTISEILTAEGIPLFGNNKILDILKSKNPWDSDEFKKRVNYFYTQYEDLNSGNASRDDRYNIFFDDTEDSVQKWFSYNNEKLRAARDLTLAEKKKLDECTRAIGISYLVDITETSTQSILTNISIFWGIVCMELEAKIEHIRRSSPKRYSELENLMFISATRNKLTAAAQEPARAAQEPARAAQEPARAVGARDASLEETPAPSVQYQTGALWKLFMQLLYCKIYREFPATKDSIQASDEYTEHLFENVSNLYSEQIKRTDTPYPSEQLHEWNVGLNYPISVEEHIDKIFFCHFLTNNGNGSEYTLKCLSDKKHDDIKIPISQAKDKMKHPFYNKTLAHVFRIICDLLKDNKASVASCPKQAGAPESGHDGPKPEGANPAGGSVLQEDPRYAKYFKMLKQGVPKAAVALKMSAEGQDAKVLDMDPNERAPADPAPADPAEGSPVLKADPNDPKYAKYFKMLKMGLPKAAVAIKMRAEGVDPAVLDMDLDKPAASPAAAAKGGPPPESRPLPLRDDPIYGEYFKMILKAEQCTPLFENPKTSTTTDLDSFVEVAALPPLLMSKDKATQRFQKIDTEKLGKIDLPKFLKEEVPSKGMIIRMMQGKGADPDVLDLDQEKPLNSQKQALAYVKGLKRETFEDEILALAYKDLMGMGPGKSMALQVAFGSLAANTSGEYTDDAFKTVINQVLGIPIIERVVPEQRDDDL